MRLGVQVNEIHHSAGSEQGGTRLRSSVEIPVWFDPENRFARASLIDPVNPFRTVTTSESCPFKGRPAEVMMVRFEVGSDHKGWAALCVLSRCQSSLERMPANVP